MYDFSGYVTRNDLKCSDGRTIIKDAFKDNDGQTVPLVWQHIHDDPNNVLGHALLENRKDGVYGYCTFNDTPSGQNAKELVRHGDITSLSIYANKLVQKGGSVLHGSIREVSLVLTGANPGAYIDNLNIQHGDSVETLDDEAIIYTGCELHHADDNEEDNMDPQTKAANDDKTIQDVIDTMTDEQKNVMYFLVGKALEDAGAGADEGDDEDVKHNIFDDSTDYNGAVLSHADEVSIFENAQKLGSLKAAWDEYSLAHAVYDDSGNQVTYGIANIDYLFPDYKSVDERPQWIERDKAWVEGVIGGAHKTPFARVKSMYADITMDEARARGYDQKGALKKEEVFKLLKRVTGPTTIYKKQKLDRDDIIDITDMDVVSWMKGEMQGQLREELARAIIVSDGRAVDDEDKINEEHIRPIWKDEDFYTIKQTVAIDPDNIATYTDAQLIAFLDSVKIGLINYKGSGNLTLYTTKTIHTYLSLIKDGFGHNLYSTDKELAAAMGVDRIVDVEVMEGLTREDPVRGTRKLLGVIVDMSDYNIGTNRGGETQFFDDFDIDYNQYKYLYETRLSGALIKPYSAVALECGVNNPTLKKLTIGSLTLTPTFSAAVTSYTATASTGGTAKVTAEASEGDAELLIKHGSTTIESGDTVTWTAGSNVITVKVTDGDEDKTYTVTVTAS